MYFAQIKAANALANAIDFIRVVLLVITGLTTAVFVITGLYQASAALIFGGLALGAVCGLVTHVTFGWFVHTLRMLAILAQHADVAAVVASRQSA